MNSATDVRPCAGSGRARRRASVGREAVRLTILTLAVRERERPDPLFSFLNQSCNVVVVLVFSLHLSVQNWHISNFSCFIFLIILFVISSSFLPLGRLAAAPD